MLAVNLSLLKCQYRSYLAAGVDIPSFVSIAAHAFPASPVSFILPSSFTDEAHMAQIETPSKVPRSDAEDTWSLVVVPRTLATGGTESYARMWMMAESIGQWDKRWG
jgi:ribonucleases P/MRP protein subunit RPP40